MGILIGILGLALLMVVHEWGHYWAARRFGMRVSIFSIGFGPTLFRVEPHAGRYVLTAFGGRLRINVGRHDPEKDGPTVFQVALIPFLAYVQIAGMNPLEPVDPGDKGSFGNGSMLARFVTLAGGPLANYFFASVLFFIALAGWGRVDVSMDSTEVTVLPGRVAEAAHLESGDRIVEVDGTSVGTWQQMADAISARPGKDIMVAALRDGNRVQVQLKPADENGKGRIGVAPRVKRVPIATSEAARLSLVTPPKVVAEIGVFLWHWVNRRVDADFGGPVRIVKEGGAAAKRGAADLFEFLGLLSASLGAFNLLPIPALDGGRLVFLGYEAAARRKPNARVEAHIHTAGIVVLLSLMVYITFFKDLGLGGR